MTPSLLPEEMYDLDFFDGWSAKEIDAANGSPILNITVDSLKKPGGITAAFSQGLEKATAYTVQELSKVAVGVAVHFTPPNGKTTTPLKKPRVGAQGVKALRRRIKADIVPLVSLTANDNPKIVLPTAIPGGDPNDPTPVGFEFMGHRTKYLPQSVGGFAFVTPKKGTTNGKKIRYTKPDEIMGHGSFFTKGRKADWVRRKARQAYTGFPLWARPKDVSAFINKKAAVAGRLISGWGPAVRLLGYKQAKADFVPNANGFAQYVGNSAEDMGFEFGNREFKDLKIARIRKDLAGRIMKWSEYGWSSILPHLEKNYLKTLKQALGV
jgi:hypothetical protein